MVSFNAIKSTLIHHSHRQCYLCGLALQPSEQYWCDYCKPHFAEVTRCPQCGLPAPSNEGPCGQCLTQPPLWNKLYCIGDYRYPLNRYIHQIKHQRQFWLTDSVSQLLAERIPQPAPLITFVPLHWRRKWYRSFNQSELLAHSLAKKLHTQAGPLFKRHQHTIPQQRLSRAERLHNLDNAFKLSVQPHHPHIAIVDDVVTTGTTMNKLCKLLLDVGVEHIDIYCLCRTPDTSSN